MTLAAKRLGCGLAWVCVTLLAACSGSSTQALRDFQMQTPRPFGYVIGDTIPQRIVLETRAGMALERNSLPTPGRLNRWLQLNAVTVQELAGSDGKRYQIDLLYQQFYAPLEVKALSIPCFTLRFQQQGQTLEQPVAAWTFTAAPLRELVVRQDQHGEYLRPDQAPPLLDDAVMVRRLYVALTVALGIALRLAWLYGYLPGLPKRSVFKRAQRQLQTLGLPQLPQALAALHTAFNGLHGKPVFLHKLTEFYQSHPEYRSIADELAWFFDYSNRYFFADASIQSQEQDLQKLKAVCRHCREIERGSR
ncbi:nonribosomal peptide synthetase MxaA [Methylomonas fluvii]|uniref:Nonribosomal peptide synthetase MxaA n=1 Tax=Methylomonas fluvii TaxID=1854564 RepID=A0ABR9DHK0_9GAMM|nr:nonribosomal peptide synthetase MxaA [Methylomonas fluvii]MBD9362584.1 nonribosomal peptide synthetase MxaA [Methylomonas fluvii]